jgi:hypothetical protein
MHGTIEGNGAPDVEEMDDETVGDHGIALRRRRVEHGVVAALVVIVLAAIALLGFRSGADEQDEVEERPAGAASATTTEASTTTTPDATDQGAAPAEPAAPTDPAAPPQVPAEPVHEHEDAPAVLADGKHPVYLTDLDVQGGTLGFDLVQWLTDDAAIAYVEAHPDEYPGLYQEIEELGSYPYDSLVANDNPRLRTLPLSDHPQVVVVFSNATGYEVFPHTIELDELPGYLDDHDDQLEHEGTLSNSVFWLTVHDGEIVAIEEQFQA